MLGNTASELVDQFGLDTFKAVHDSDQDGLVYFRADGTIEYINRAALRLFGVDEEVIGQNIYDIKASDYDCFGVDVIHPADHFDRARQAFLEGTPSRSELVVVDNNTRRELEVVWGPVEQDGERVGVVGSYRDISPRPDIHDQLSREVSRIDEQRRFLASVIDVIDDGILVFDANECLQLINPSASRMLGLKSPAEGRRLETIAENSSFRQPDRFVEFVRQAESSEGDVTVTLYTKEGVEGRQSLQGTGICGKLDRGRTICKLTNTSQRIEFQQLELLSDIASIDSLGREEVNVLADEIVGAIAEGLEVDFVVLARLRDDELVPFAWRGVMLDESMGLGLNEREEFRQVLDEQEVRRIDDWPWGCNCRPSEVGQLVIPLNGTSEQFGTLHLGFLKPSARTSDRSSLAAVDRTFTRALGHYVSAALSSALLSEQTITHQDRLISVLEALSDGIIIYNRRGEVLLTNEAARSLTSIDNGENLNTTDRPYRVLTPERSPLARSDWPFFRAVQTDEMSRAEVIFDFDEYQRDIILRATPIESGDDLPIYLGQLRDVTERRQLDRRKDEFLSIASHELRSPLTPLTGVLQLARRQLERGEEVDVTLLTRAERQIARLTRLIDGLLDLTRIETDRINLTVETIDFGSFVREQIRPWQLNPKDVEIEVETPERPLEVEIDPDRINQVLTNVVDNAIKYSKPTGVIRIEVGDGGEAVCLAIEDEGVGMDEETVDRIFDRFFHGPASQGGTTSMGLGLYICRQIVEQHGGDITVDSTKGVGTRIEITLPKVHETTPAETSAE